LTPKRFDVSHSGVRYAAISFLCGAGLCCFAACASDLAAPEDTPDASTLVISPVTSDGSSTTDGTVPTADGSIPTDGTVAVAADCTRETRAKTAPVSLYDAFVSDMAPISAEAPRRARVAAFLADVRAKGGGPLEDPASDRVVFLVDGAPPAGPWSVLGGFVAWDKARTLSMTKVAGTDLWIADARIPRGTAHAYKLLSGTTDTGFREDLVARNVVWDGIDHKTVGEMNAIVHADAVPKDKPRMVAFRGVPSAAMGNARDVFVWLPSAYDGPSCKKLPVVVFHDGNESLTRGDFVGPAETLYKAKPELSSILAFVALPNQNVRMDEYTFATAGSKGPLYAKLVADELLPQLGKDFRVCANPKARGVSGASLGGLISTFIAFEKPTAFGWVGAQSSSYFWADNAMITRASQDAKIPVRFYLDSGCPDDNCVVTDRMETTLKAKTYDVVRIKEQNAEHDWAFWNRRMTGMLTHFREGQTAICD
jgi:iron(III)-enterobactin esterase